MNSSVAAEHPPSHALRDALGSSMDDLLQVRAALDEHSMVCTTDSQGFITYVNGKFCEVTGYNRQEWLGQNHHLLQSEYHTEEFYDDLWQTISRGAVWRGEIQSRAQDGTCFWVAATIVPILDEDAKPGQFLSVCLDITEHKRLKAELEVRQHLQHLLADLSTQFVALPNEQVDSAILRTLQQIVEFMGLDRATLWQREDEQPGGMMLTHHWQRPGFPPLLPRFQPEENFPWIHEKIIRGEVFQFTRWSELPPEASREAALFRANGPKSLICIPLIGTGRTFGVLAFTTVLAERKWLPDEVTELKLVAQIIANVIGRRRAEERAEQLREEIAHSARASMLGELAAALAHELNQPLTAILSNAQAGRRFLSSGTIEPEEVGAILDDIARDGRRAGGVVHHLRAMLSNASPPREDCCLNEVIYEVTEFLHSEFVSQNIEVRYFLDPSPPKVHATRVEMQQILVNLLMNAIHAMKDTPAANRRIDITTQATKTKVTVKVRDHGSGIPAKELSSIFQPFFTTKSGGLGMGLSICRRMIEAHDGFIAACNHEDGGAVFAFSVPCVEALVDSQRG
ncbi:ATP-binding protein [Roseimicrobium sp. ORNL1]|uniref:PAS domain-containing sensor histidine kinase n=1 Tax=Roseimicrobium sp. ORNL1 TaxID=2711231 RepID=UPI0013E16C1A|nr:ATP-binding protein [Roseimicrobium sp. ORNL1]QIF02311.1 PAS domain S-box protein [Roseimicrobium sp. ORNL1]